MEAAQIPATGSSGPARHRGPALPEALARLGRWVSRPSSTSGPRGGRGRGAGCRRGPGAALRVVPVTAESFSPPTSTPCRRPRRPLVRPRAASLRLLEPRGAVWAVIQSRQGKTFDEALAAVGRPGSAAAAGGGRPEGARARRRRRGSLESLRVFRLSPSGDNTWTAGSDPSHPHRWIALQTWVLPASASPPEPCRSRAGGAATGRRGRGARSKGVLTWPLSESGRPRPRLRRGLAKVPEA